MTREHDQFQIQLITTPAYVTCVKCKDNISIYDDPEHIIVMPPDPMPPWRFHVVCFGEVTDGMVKFFKVFVTDNKKVRLLQ